MGAGELDAHRGSIESGMQLGGDRAEAFGQDSIRATVKETYRLSIPFNRHSADNSLGRCLEDLNSHLASKLAASSLHEEFHVIRDDTIIGHMAMIVALMKKSPAVAHSPT